MEAIKETRKLVVSRFEADQNVFYLKPQNESLEEQAVSCKLKLQGVTNGESRTVNTGYPLTNYQVFRFINPYLNAQNDLFRVKYGEKSIGYIIPFAAIEEGDETPDVEFDEPQQAYKYYCVKSILEEFDFPVEPTAEPIPFSDLVDKNSIFVILFKPQIDDVNFKVEDCLPSFAVKGYYFFPKGVSPNVLSIAIDKAGDVEFSNLIDARFYCYRGNHAIKIDHSRDIIDNNPMMQLLYKKLLAESNNSLHRFLILYQVIEFLVDKRIRKDIEAVLAEKDTLTNYRFVQRINELNNTRSTINKLFERVHFDEKAEITNSLRDFILEFDADSKSQTAGDCLYDIRNLLFHDFKSVLEKNKDGAVTSLVIQCEILIHQLLVSLGKNADEPVGAIPVVPLANDVKPVADIKDPVTRKWFQFWKP